MRNSENFLHLKNQLERNFYSSVIRCRRITYKKVTRGPAQEKRLQFEGPIQQQHVYL